MTLKPTNNNSLTQVSRRQMIAASVTTVMLSASRVSAQDTVAATDTDSETAMSVVEEARQLNADSVLRYESPRTDRWKFGMILETPTTLSNALATFVVPMDWPEQKITPVQKNIDPLVTGWEIRSLQDGAKQVALQMNRVNAGSSVEVSFELDVERTRILPARSVDGLVIPQRLPSELRVYMGNSPDIDTSNSRIKKAARDLDAENKSAENDWKRVERIYDYVREQVQYVEGPIRRASDALRRGEGDCEDMTSLFVALCRNLRIPARMVWIPDHCYPEFYLEDAEGVGTWYPCQAAGSRQFGRMDEYRPILQKGDRFKVAERKLPVRYVSEFFRCDRKSNKKPSLTWIRQMIGA
ncbi:Transglutaminase-like superfamily protein [Rubripirellula obstinata]|uniref:Transglutaminase-like superfamily protein n=1 Tax=Rubripirellula obstinata TaxID=406547 RepID=A0A5B1CMI9_9BACT|nr:transglutaminase-like domain-containing protein [Rubripirellula obstinata]KAA1261501.1 Transglutaminase-like superfamily protein [Rubripirellula obstinata]